jgi:hypothetical protein
VSLVSQGTRALHVADHPRHNLGSEQFDGVQVGGIEWLHDEVLDAGVSRTRRPSRLWMLDPPWVAYHAGVDVVAAGRRTGDPASPEGAVVEQVEVDRRSER